MVTFHFLLPLKALPQLQVSILFYLPGWIKGEKNNWTGKGESALCFKNESFILKVPPKNLSFIFHFQPGVMKESWDQAYAPWVCRPCTLCPLCPRTQPHRRLWPHLHAKLQSGSRRGLCLLQPHTLSQNQLRKLICFFLLLFKLPFKSYKPAATAEPWLPSCCLQWWLLHGSRKHVFFF